MKNIIIKPIGDSLGDLASLLFVSANSFGTKIVLLIGLLGFLTDRPEFLDIALLYALVNFIGTIAILKFFRYRNMGLSSDEIASREDER